MMKTDIQKEHDVAGTLTIALFVVGIALGLGWLSTGCGAATRAAGAVVDCTQASAPALGALVDEFKVLLSGDRPNWDSIKAKAIAAGVTIGGCALAIVVAGEETEPVARRTESLIDPRHEGRAVLEEYRRAYAGGAAFRLPSGELR
jgi:F0F1-type ATP synthase membrane subunit c/vacuolar-type H+-ATPase subunit K